MNLAYGQLQDIFPTDQLAIFETASVRNIRLRRKICAYPLGLWKQHFLGVYLQVCTNMPHYLFYFAQHLGIKTSLVKRFQSHHQNVWVAS